MSYAASLAGLTTMALHGRIEVFDRYLGVERLTQEAGCSGFQCLRPDAHCMALQLRATNSKDRADALSVVRNGQHYVLAR
jgi:hypothetical protein